MLVSFFPSNLVASWYQEETIENKMMKNEPDPDLNLDLEGLYTLSESERDFTSKCVSFPLSSKIGVNSKRRYS